MWSGRFSVDALGRPLHCGTPNLTRSHRPRLFQNSAKCGRCQSFRPTWLPDGTGFAGMALPVTSVTDSGLVRQGQGGRSPRCPPCATSPSAKVLRVGPGATRLVATPPALRTKVGVPKQPMLGHHSGRAGSDKGATTLLSARSRTAMGLRAAAVTQTNAWHWFIAIS